MREEAAVEGLLDAASELTSLLLWGTNSAEEREPEDAEQQNAGYFHHQPERSTGFHRRTLTRTRLSRRRPNSAASTEVFSLRRHPASAIPKQFLKQTRPGGRSFPTYIAAGFAERRLPFAVSIAMPTPITRPRLTIRATACGSRSEVLRRADPEHEDVRTLGVGSNPLLMANHSAEIEAGYDWTAEM